MGDKIQRRRSRWKPAKRLPTRFLIPGDASPVLQYLRHDGRQNKTRYPCLRDGLVSLLSFFPSVQPPDTCIYNDQFYRAILFVPAPLFFLIYCLYPFQPFVWSLFFWERRLRISPPTTHKRLFFKRNYSASSFLSRQKPTKTTQAVGDVYASALTLQSRMGRELQ